MSETGLTRASRRRIGRDFKILTLDDKRKKKVLRNVIKENRKDATKNIRGQKAPRGGKWTPRKKRKTFTDKRGRTIDAPMLKRIMRNTRNTATSTTGKLTYKNSVSARIAAEHQDGAILPVKQGKNEREPQEPRGNMATAAQAELLLQLGFNEPKHPAERKRGKDIGNRRIMELWAKRMIEGDRSRRKSSSVSYITSNLTFGQAGALIALLKKQQGITGRKSETMKLPSRPFLDESPEQTDALFEQELDKEITQKLK